MRIGIMLRHYEQHEGGVKHYTKTLLPLLFSLGTEHQFILIYQNPNLLGTYAGYPNVEELVARIPGTLLWDQIAVPWVIRNKNLDISLIRNLPFPFLRNPRKYSFFMVPNGSRYPSISNGLIKYISANWFQCIAAMPMHLLRSQMR